MKYGRCLLLFSVIFSMCDKYIKKYIDRLTHSYSATQRLLFRANRFPDHRHARIEKGISGP